MEDEIVTKPPTSLELEQHEQQIQSKSPIGKILIVASVGAGVQFGWALQFSLLTPYVQLLGIPHKWAAFIWLCGPISGMFVQPSVGYYSDRSTSRFGRRRPFIGVGAALVVVSVFLIGFAADLGHLLGDSTTKKTLKPRAVSVFVIGFWIFDVANNTLTGPCRAFLADLSGNNHKTMRTANVCFSFFLAVGNVLGYAAGSYSRLHTIFPFTSTKACDVYCANLKSCFLIAVVLLVTVTTLCLVLVPEPPYLKPKPIEENDGKTLPFFQRILHGLRTIPRPMWILLLVMSLNSLALFPFLLFDTDWMGREVYGGRVGEDNGAYDRGVRAGTLGLMLNSVVLGFTSLSVGVLVRGRVGGGLKKLWGCANFFLAVCLGLTVLITKLAQSSRDDARGLSSPLPGGIKAAALALFAVMGVPLAVTYSIPFTLVSIFSNTSGAGQGLSLGVLNLAVVIPQLFVSVVSGPWDALFGGGNLPAFVVGAIAAAASGVVALTILPSPPPNIDNTKIVSNVGHS